MAKQPKMDGAHKLQGQTEELQEEGNKGKALAVCMFYFGHFFTYITYLHYKYCTWYTLSYWRVCWNNYSSDPLMD